MVTTAANMLWHLQAALEDVQKLNPEPDSTPGPLEKSIPSAAYSVMTDLQDAIPWAQKCVDLGG